MNAKTFTAYLGGTWHKGYGVAPCPCCQTEARKDQNALTITDGQSHLLLNCKKSHCAFTDILNAAGINSGDYRPPDPAIIVQRKAEQDREARKRAGMATSAWNEATSIHGTAAEHYLRNRGITSVLPDSLRFLSSCWHSSGKRIPALIGLVAPLVGVSPTAIHRTYLSIDGDCKANVQPNKAMLGSTAGGCVGLSNGAGPLVVVEGIETGLSLSSGLLSEPAHVVAALSTAGIRGLILPPCPTRLIIASDGDDAGRIAANVLAERAFVSGWDVSLMAAPDCLDWNDVLLNRGTR